MSTTELRRSLSFADLVIYGLIFIGPVSPFAFFGYVSDASKGMVALAYAVGAVAMFFTAYSYKLLSADYPLSGSVFAYARRAIGEKTGFVAGWMLVLDYLLTPAGVYLAASYALHDIVPGLPRLGLAVGFVGFGTVVNYFGVQIASAVNKVLLVVVLALLAVFLFLGMYALYHGAGAGHLTLNPLYRPGAFSVGTVFSAVSLASVSFLGFDGIATLAEEAKGDSRRVIGRATIACLVIVAGLFVAQTWVAADLANGKPFASLDTAFYEVAGLAGGKLFGDITALAAVIIFGLSAATTVQSSIARLLYSMARDGRMPAFMARLHPRFNTPYLGILFVSGVSVAMAVTFVDHFDVIVTLVNFGALTGFLLLHVTVVVHFIVRRRSRSYIRHLVCPAIGFCIIGYVLYYMDPRAWELGTAWFVVGLIGYGLFFRKKRASSSAIDPT